MNVVILYLFYKRFIIGTEQNRIKILGKMLLVMENEKDVELRIEILCFTLICWNVEV